jgi:hypothetical protein
MLALLLKLAAWMGLWGAPRASVPNVAEPEPRPVPVTPPERRSARCTSPLATRRGRRTGRSQRIVLAAVKPPISKAARRPKSTPPAPKRTPGPRHVWLESRTPAAARSPAATVIALPSPHKRSGNLGLRAPAAA